MLFSRRKAPRKCDRCGKAVVSGGPAGPDTAISSDATGETLCAECMLKMMRELGVNEDTGPRVDQFLASTVTVIARHTGLSPSVFLARCKTFIGSDVEIKCSSTSYDLTLFTQLMDD